MKPIAVFVLVAAVSVGGLTVITPAAQGKTTTSSQGNADEKSAAAVAGPAAAANSNEGRQKTDQLADTSQPSKKVLKKTQIKPPPLLHDPN